MTPPPATPPLVANSGPQASCLNSNPCLPTHVAALRPAAITPVPASQPSLLPPGLLVPDIPVEETAEIREVASRHGIELVLLVTPTTPQERMARIAKESEGFVYLVSVTGGWVSG